MPRIKKYKEFKQADKNSSGEPDSNDNGKIIRMPSHFSHKYPLKHILLITILVVGLLFWKFKGLFIAAVVNGQPISRWQLNDELKRKFGEQTLETMVNERLILAAARQKGIFITADEIDNRIKEVEDRLKGKISLEDALKAQGVNKEEFKRQLEIQLSIDRLFADQATVSGTEISEYLDKNKETTRKATNPAVLRVEVEGILKQQKMSDLFEKWFAEIRKSAKIDKYQ